MSRNLFGFWIIVTVLTASMPVWADEQADFFPLGEGMVWTYGGNPLEMARMIRVAGVEETSDGPVYFVDGFQGKRELLKQSDGKILERRGSAWRLLCDLGAEVGASWTIEQVDEADDLLDGMTATVISRSAEVTVPYGTFKGCIHLGARPRPGLADAGVTNLWFAPDVGLVKWTETWIGGEQAYELMAFADKAAEPGWVPRDSVVVPLPVDPVPTPLPEPGMPPWPGKPFEDYGNGSAIERNGLRYEVATDTSVYTQEDAVFIQYRVTTVDRDSAAFRFSSTQNIEFVLVDEEGRKLWTWSMVRIFGEAITGFTLKRGESRTFSESLELGALALPEEGTYRLIGYLPTMPGEGIVERADTEVEVRLKVYGGPPAGGDPSTVRLFGEVIETLESGDVTPLPGARVVVTPAREVETGGRLLPTQEVWSDRSGRYTFDRLQPGDYVVTASKIDYRPATATVTLSAGEYPLRLALERGTKEDYLNANAWTQGGLRAELATDRQAYAVGDSVFLRYRLTNTTGDSLMLTFPSGQQYDLILEGPRGKAWQWSEGRLFTQAIMSQMLAPGDTFEFKEALVLSEGWAQPGDYYAMTGYLAVRSDELTLRPGGSPVRSDGSRGVSRADTEAGVKFMIPGDGEVKPPPGPGPDPLPPVERRLKADMRVTLSASGDSVRAHYVLVNAVASPLKLMFRSGQRYDLVLEGPEGEVWRWSAGRGFDDALHEQDLAPGDTVVVQEVFPLPEAAGAVAGTYVLSAFMAVTPDEPETVAQSETEVRVKWTVQTGGAVKIERPTDASDPMGPEARKADFDGDDAVDFSDFVMFAKAFGKTADMPGFDRTFDLDGNDAVGFSDFLMFVSAYHGE